MNFALGNVNIALVGKSPIVEHLGKILEVIQTKESKTDLVFEFVDELPHWTDQSYIPIENYIISDDRLRVTDKLFCYELRPFENPPKVSVAIRKTDFFRKAQRAIRKSWRYFHTHNRSAYLHYLKRFVFYVYMPLVEMILLKNHASLAHCSAVEKENRVVLFAAWGGVGKTGIMSRYLNGDWKFLADDSCIITDEGIAYIHPLPMHIYKYHETQSRELVKKMLSQSSMFDKLLWRTLSFIKKPDKLVRWVSADKVFGNDKISTQGNVSTVIHMHKQVGYDTFKLETIAPNQVSKLMANTMLDEINNLANTAIVVHSCKPSNFIPDISHLHRCITDIYSSAFRKANCYTIAIPKHATAESIYDFIENNKLL